jgi:hypothetical protein
VYALLSHYDELSLRKITKFDQVSNNVRMWTNNYQLLLQNTKEEEEEEKEKKKKKKNSNSVNKNKTKQ